MKSEIHPEYFETTIRCVCGNEILTRATKKTFALRFAQPVIHFTLENKGL